MQTYVKRRIVMYSITILIFYLCLMHYLRSRDQQRSRRATGKVNIKDSVRGEVPVRELYGEMGEPVILSDISPEIQSQIEDGYKKHNLNKYVSDLISLHRHLPDYRDDWCTIPYRYEVNLTRTSVVISFHNEAWSVLLRTIYSVLDRTPPRLIEEIILVDDFSDMEHLKRQLEDYWESETKVKIIRNTKREGLKQSRYIGALHATGEVLTFLDSRVEVTPGWLEPLLERVRINNTAVVSPVVDTINGTTLEYHAYKTVYLGGFDWGLNFQWYPIPKREESRRFHYAEPLYSPDILGSTIVVSKNFFQELMKYDENLVIWEGENIELSLKTWMCGGTLEIVPCSHVGRIFLNKTNNNTNEIKQSSKRLAEVWLGDYKQYYYQRIGDKNVSTQTELKKQLNCNSFAWYLNNVYPEMFIPDKIYGHGQIGTTDKAFCLSRINKNYGMSVSLEPCSSQSYNQFWYYTQQYKIRTELYCLESSESTKEIVLKQCKENDDNQQWTYDPDLELLVHVQSARCLIVSDEKLKVEMCNLLEKHHKWFVENIDTNAIKAVLENL